MVNDRYASHADGTCTYISRCALPCTASGGATTSERTALTAMASRAATPRRRSPARDVSLPSRRSSGRVRRFISPLSSSRLGLRGRGAAAVPARRVQANPGSDREQVLHQVVLLLVREAQVELRVVVVHHVAEGGEA